MSRLGITFEQVETAADRIVTEGLNPTIEKIRQALGGTGSNSTIARYLNDWKAQRQLGQRPVPVVTPDPVNAAVKRVWEQIREETDKEIENIREQAMNEVKAAQESLQIQIELKNKLQVDNTDLLQQLNKLMTEKDLLLIENKKIQQTLLLEQERYQAIKEQFSIYKQKTESQLSEMKHFHKNEIERQQEHTQMLQQSYDNLFSQLKAKHDEEKQYFLQQMTDLKEEQVTFKKTTANLTQLSQQSEKQVIKLTVELELALKKCEAFTKENATLLEEIASYHKAKRGVIENTLQAIHDTCEHSFLKITNQVVEQEHSLHQIEKNIAILHQNFEVSSAKK